MKWEYKTIFIHKDWTIDEPLNDYGEDGWEVYHVEFDRVMKRPKAQGETP